MSTGIRSAKPAAEAASGGLVSGDSSSFQRHSYKATKAGSGISGSAAEEVTHSHKPRGRLASLEPLDAPHPTSHSLPRSPRQQQHQQQQEAEEKGKAADFSAASAGKTRPVPGKLSASRFGNFRGGAAESTEGQEKGDNTERGSGYRGRGVSGKGLGIESGITESSPRRWTVGPSSSPPKLTAAPDVEEEDEPSVLVENDGGVSSDLTVPLKGESGRPDEEEEGEEKGEEVSSVGSLATRFGGSVRVAEEGEGKRGLVEGNVGSGGKGRGFGSGIRKSGGRSRRIAELARNFQK